MDNKRVSWNDIVKKCVNIRAFEEAIEEIYKDDLIQSPIHLSIGQEITSVMIIENLTENDYVVGNYRSHALTLARTKSIDKVIRELCAKQEGMFGGRAGSMHLGDPEMNMPWTSAIVGTGVPVATGIAWVSKQEQNGIVVVQFGDGAMEEGCVLESFNIAATYELPIVFIMEDNNLAINTKQERRKPKGNSNIKKAESFGITSYGTTTKMPHMLEETFKKAFNKTRKEHVPTFVSVECFRWRQHVGIGGDYDKGFRDESEIEEWANTDIVLNPETVGIQEKTYKEQQRLKEYYINKFRIIAKERDPIK